MTNALKQIKENAMRVFIIHELKKSNWVIAAAARSMQMKRPTLIWTMRKLKIEVPKSRRRVKRG